MILCIGTTPAAQRVMVFQKLTIDAVNRAASTLDSVAGKSVNVAKVLKALGERPLATGFLGGDRGRRVRLALKTLGIAEEFVQIQVSTRQCITVIDRSADQVTELVEESRPVSRAAYGALMKLVEKRTKQCRALVLSGSITPGGPVNFYFDCARLANAAGAISVVDAQGPVLVKALEAGPGLIKPNLSELAATVGRPLKNVREVTVAMRELCERGAKRIVVTAGREPVIAFDGRCLWRITPPRIVAVNPIGSGDAFTAGLTWRLLRGDDLGEACRWASAAGAANALTLLAGEVHRRDVARLAKLAEVETWNDRKANFQ